MKDRSRARKLSFWDELKTQRASYYFIFAPFFLFFVFVMLPTIASFALSFFRYNGIQPPTLIGFENYVNIIVNDIRFRKALLNTIYFVLGTVPLGVAFAVILAVAIDQKIKFKNFFKGVLFLPTVTSIVASAVIWQWLFAGGKYGLINYFLVMKMGGRPIEWLMNQHSLLPAIMIMSVWAGMGYNVILFLAGLQTIPPTMYEAAEVDGAGFWHKFFHITLPLLKPTIVFVTVMSCINSFQAFEQIFIMTSAGGNQIGGVLDSALTVVPYLYDEAFYRFNFGYASAMAYILFLFILGLTVLNKKFVQTRVEY